LAAEAVDSSAQNTDTAGVCARARRSAVKKGECGVAGLNGGLKVASPIYPKRIKSEH